METKDLVLLMLIPIILVSLIVYTDENPVITGAATSKQEESNIIGAYSIMPSFKAKINYNVEDEYQEISKQLNEIIDKCKNSIDIEKCLKDNSKEWGCLELKDEVIAILYDFIDKFNECSNLKEEGIVCSFLLDEREIINTPFKSFEIRLTNENQRTRVELLGGSAEGPKVLRTEYINLENIVYTVYDYKDTLNEKINPVRILIKFEGKKPIIEDVFAYDDNLNRIPLSKTFLLYKKDNKIKFVEAPGSSFEAPVPANRIIDIPQAKGIKFCAKSKYKFYTYDESDKTTKLRDVVYKFAVTFPIPIPKSIENLEVLDNPKAENSVILVWDKNKESNIKYYSVYYSKNNFVDVKLDDVKKDKAISKKTVLNEPIDVNDIDLNNCIINPAGTPCKSSIYNNHLEKDKLYYWTSKNKLIYLLSDSANLKDGIEYNFAVTAVNEVNKELDNDKSIIGNTYVLTTNKNYKISMPIDDLAPSSENLVILRIQQIYDSDSKKVTFNFAQLPKVNADGSTLKDFKNYLVYYIKYSLLTQQQKAEVINSIMNSELNKLKLIQTINYEQQGYPFFIDLSSTNPQSGDVYFFVIITSDNLGNPKEDQFKVKELGAIPLQLTIS
ncbi:hypothetical protein HYX03_01515 [Candidatus Woesearchaeota archaeon]|nr:hypothetical protein [Candidatus Woesearchaeota archaeon]